MITTQHSASRSTVLRSWTLAACQAAAGAYFTIAGALALLDLATAARGPTPLAWSSWAWGLVAMLELLGGIGLVFARTARTAAVLLLALVGGVAAVHLARIDLFPALLEPLLLSPLLLVAYNGNRAREHSPAVPPTGHFVPSNARRR